MPRMPEPTPQNWQPSPTNPSFFSGPPKMLFAMGIMVGITVISVVGFLLSFNAYRNATGTGTTKTAAATNTNTAGAAGGTPTAPATPVDVKVDEKNDWITGNKNAKVTLVEFSDFQCPYCGQFEPTVVQVLRDYKDKVRVVYKHYPLTSIHPQAQKAAEASECAGAQGKFWEMHDKLFTNQATLSVDNEKAWAKDLGLNTSKFNTCLDKGEKVADVAADQKYGDTVGVTGTPTSFVNGYPVQGAQGYDFVKNLIDQELAKV